MRLNPYPSFRDNASEAMAFYQSVFGGDLETSTFGDMHASEDPAEAQKVTHSMLSIADGLTLMGSDTPNSMEFTPRSSADSPAGMTFTPRAGAPIALTGDEEGVLRGYWDALVDGGTVTADLVKAPWGDYFGMCTDKYGVEWMVDIGTPA